MLDCPACTGILRYWNFYRFLSILMCHTNGEMGISHLFSRIAILPWLTTMVVVLSRMHAAKGQRIPAAFILGDSLVDVGNNNYIVSLAKSNYPPNGLDFPQGVTGRFCNGRNSGDIVFEMMGLPPPPAYLSPMARGRAILQGINYASGAAGILDSTGFNLVGRIPLNKQLDDVRNTRSQFVELLGEAKTAEIFAKSLWYITIGSNDYINNYLVKGSVTSRQYNPQQYQDLLISTYNQQLRRLYDIGARKIFVFGVGPLGCVPSELYQHQSPDGRCIEFINGYVRGFNAALRTLVKQLTASLPGSVYVWGNVYDQVAAFVAEPARFGFSSVNTACCGGGPYKGLIPCLPTVKPCADRAAYLFWDPFHPTDRANQFLARAFFSGGTDVMDPVNIQQLASMP